jgi:hypothetical protein
MLVTLVIPFICMVFMSLSMKRVWALYNMIQLLVNLNEYKKLTIPGNLGYVLRVLAETVNFSILDQEPVQIFLKKHVFKKTQAIQKILVGQGAFITGLIFISFAILIVKLGQRIKMAEVVFTKLKNKLMFSSIFRSQIQTYFPTCILIFSFLLAEEDLLMTSIKLLIVLGLPVFSWVFLKKYQNRVLDSDFQAKYGTLIENLAPL